MAHEWESESDTDAVRRVAPAPAHAWETDSDAPSGESCESDDGPDSGDDCNSSEEDLVEPTPGEKFVAYLESLMLSRRMTAKEFCTICHYASACGVGEAKTYSVSPNAPSGHFQRKVDAKFDCMRDNSRLYTMAMPMFTKKNRSRCVNPQHVSPGHELIADRYSDDWTGASMRVRLQEAIDDEELPPAYFNHPVVAEHGAADPVLPLALFLDGLPYSLTDSIIGFWFVNVVTGARFLMGTFRKRRFCRCGCKGWCSSLSLELGHCKLLF